MSPICVWLGLGNGVLSSFEYMLWYGLMSWACFTVSFLLSISVWGGLAACETAPGGASMRYGYSRCIPHSTRIE